MRALIYDLAIGKRASLRVGELVEIVTARGWEVALAQGDLVAGTRDDRPQRRAALAALDAGSVDVLVVWDLSRWARGTPELVGLAHRLRSSGLHLLAVADQVDTTDPWSAGRWRDACGLLDGWWSRMLGDSVRVAEERGRRVVPTPAPRFAAIHPLELAALWNGGLTQRELRRKLRHAPQTIKRHLDRADKAGLLDHALHARALEARGKSHRPGRPKGRRRVSLAPWHPPARERGEQRAATTPGPLQDFGADPPPADRALDQAAAIARD